MLTTEQIKKLEEMGFLIRRGMPLMEDYAIKGYGLYKANGELKVYLQDGDFSVRYYSLVHNDIQLDLAALKAMGIGEGK